MNSYEKAMLDFLLKAENYRVVFEIRPYIDEVFRRKLVERQQIFLDQLRQEIKPDASWKGYFVELRDDGAGVRFSNHRRAGGVELAIFLDMSDKNCWFGLGPIERFTRELANKAQSLFPQEWRIWRYKLFDRQRPDLYDPDVTEEELRAVFGDWIAQFLPIAKTLQTYLQAAEYSSPTNS